MQCDKTFSQKLSGKGKGVFVEYMALKYLADKRKGKGLIQVAAATPGLGIYCSKSRYVHLIGVTQGILRTKQVVLPNRWSTYPRRLTSDLT